jgi:tRNA-Thr(GGU) m(6)t(6)A37 methyltransferase TsaA
MYRQISVEPIGYVVNTVEEPVDSGWGEIESRLVLREALSPALVGLEEFSHVLVVYWMHWAVPLEVLRRRPQGREDMPEVGLLAQRSKHRPNPIGVTVVTLVSVRDGELVVRGLDAINGTPVLDIKPHYPEYDSPPGAHVPEWVRRLMKGYFEEGPEEGIDAHR